MHRHDVGCTRAPDRRELEHAIRQTVDVVSAPLSDELGGGRVRWGDQLDVRPLNPEQRREVAGYLAKYATKSTEQAGGVLHRVTEHQVDALPVREHVRAYMREGFGLNADPALADRRLGACAHALGYRGHCLTKSRRYSTTFKALREAREAFVRERFASFRYVGQGHLTAADALLASSAATRAREWRRWAREKARVAGGMATARRDGVCSVDGCSAVNDGREAMAWS